MPAPNNEEAGYRREPGSSVAVRLDPRKEKGWFDLNSLLRKNVLFSPVRVEFDDKYFGGDSAELIDQPWCEREMIALSPNSMLKIEEFLGVSLMEPLQLEILPVNLTKHSPTPEFRGQILIAELRATREWSLLLELIELFGSLEAEIRLRENGDLFLKISVDFRMHEEEFEADLTDDAKRLWVSWKSRINSDFYAGERSAMGDCSVGICNLFEKVGGSCRELLRRAKVRREERDRGAMRWISHNGISVPLRLPSRRKSFFKEELYLAEFSFSDGSYSWRAGAIALADSIRPDVSVSRDRLIKLPWRMYSASALALHRAIRSLDIKNGLATNVFDEFLVDQPLTLGHLLEDDLLTGENGWIDEPVVRTNKGWRTLRDLKASNQDHWIEARRLRGVVDYVIATLIQVGLTVSLVAGPRLMYRVSSGVASGPILEGHKLFPPLMFVPFENSDAIVTWPVAINANARFSRWFLENAPAISSKFPGIFEKIRDELLAPSSNSWVIINESLERLGELSLRLRPPQSVLLTKDHFFWQRA